MAHKPRVCDQRRLGSVPWQRGRGIRDVRQQNIGTAIMMFMQGTKKERPLTHDLLASILRALGAKIERVIVNDLQQTTYFVRCYR